jgi:hypothetical protein
LAIAYRKYQGFGGKRHLASAHERTNDLQTEYGLTIFQVTYYVLEHVSLRLKA